MSDLHRLLDGAPHHLLVRIDQITVEASSSTRSSVTINALVADAPRSRPDNAGRRFESGDLITFHLDHSADFIDLLKVRQLYEVILNNDLHVVEGIIEEVDDFPEDPRYTEFGAFHG